MSWGSQVTGYDLTAQLKGANQDIILPQHYVIGIFIKKKKTGTLVGLFFISNFNTWKHPQIFYQTFRTLIYDKSVMDLPLHCKLQGLHSSMNWAFSLSKAFRRTAQENFLLPENNTR